LAAARRLGEAGKRAGLLLNDQGDELVDTHFASAAGFPAGQVSGGCFCCRFSDFITAASQFRDIDVLFAEPVGSCTDVAATVLEPLHRLYGRQFRTAPFTVVVDPARLAALDGQPGDIPWLFRNQLAEANILVLSKADLYPDFPPPPNQVVFRVSATTGAGLDEWLHEVLDAEANCDLHFLDIDYNRYAAAEAALGWVNWKVRFRAARPRTSASIAGPLLEYLAFRTPGIAHLKVFVSSPEGWVKASVGTAGAEPVVEGALDTPPVRNHQIVLNLRAEASPELLDSLVEQAIAQLPGRATIELRQAFRPAAPRRPLVSAHTLPAV